MRWTPDQVAKHIDLAALKPCYTWEDAYQTCVAAARWGCASVCVSPRFLPTAIYQLMGRGTAVGTVIGFPHGGFSLTTKLRECEEALSMGANELDIVLTAANIKNGGPPGERRWASLTRELEAYATLPAGGVKVILETCYLTPYEIGYVCDLASLIGGRIRYVKTSTGYGTRGASIEDVRTMQAACAGRLGVKASGGIRTFQAAVEFLEHGCSRLGVGSIDFLEAEQCRTT